MKYYLGLDNGGTTTKAVIFDETGNEISKAGMSTAMLTPKPGYIERDMEEMWQANASVIREAIEKAGIDASDISCAAVCGHGKGLYLWGKDEKPCGRGIISTDNRAYAYPEKWKADGTEEKVFALSLQHILSCQPVSLLAWIRDNEPSRYANIKYVFECKDYIRFRLTGEAGAELTDYSGANLLNLHTGNYDKELLRLFGIPEIEEALPPLCASDKICGYVTQEAAKACGLKEGTPVAGGMFDIDACAAGADVLCPENICMIAGTWSINEYPARKPVTDGKVLMNSLFALPEYYLIEESSPTSAGNNEWFIRRLLPELKENEKKEGRSIYDTLNLWVDEIGTEEFVPVFLPFLMASNVHPNGKAAFIGMTANHTRKHLARAVYEGIVFSHRWHYEKLLSTREDKPKLIRLAGGAAHSSVWTQMFADVLKTPVETVTADETGALGCAIAAAAAVGDYPSMEKAAEKMCRIAGRVEPNPSVYEVYDKKYELYKAAIDSLNSFWDKMQKMM